METEIAHIESVEESESLISIKRRNEDFRSDVSYSESRINDSKIIEIIGGFISGRNDCKLDKSSVDIKNVEDKKIEITRFIIKGDFSGMYKVLELAEAQRGVIKHVKFYKFEERLSRTEVLTVEFDHCLLIFD